MTQLVVSTLTERRWRPFRDECIASVAAALPPGGRHVLHYLEGDVDFQEERWRATVDHDAEFVAFVDDDDLVEPDALARCVDALERTGAGVAFTFEGWINEAGQEIPAQPHRQITRRDIAMHPRSLHHLAVIRREALDGAALVAALEIGIGIDWLMRAWCALKHDAVQVPTVGYWWRQHTNQTSRCRGWDAAYMAAMPQLRAFLNPLLGFERPIRQFEG